MRRAKTDLPISPKLLKHFAAATVAITFCIAIFADGSTTEAVKETVKHNEVKKTEVDLLGARKLVNNTLKVAPTRSMPDEDPPMLEQELSGRSAIQVTPQAIGTPMVLPSQYARPEDMLPQRQAAMQANKQYIRRKPTDAEITAMRRAGGERGQAGYN